MIEDLPLNEELLKAGDAVNRAESFNIVERCRNYLWLLAKYRDELFNLRRSAVICQTPLTPLALQLKDEARRAIRTAVENTTRERNKIESLIRSFTAISGYEAIGTFNQLKYRGIDTWELRSDGARIAGSVGDAEMSVQESVETAGRLRREEYVAHKTTFFT